ncbi:MAG TPA: amidohydrolase family protein [Bdellovibrionota bacterium]|nr:amidohydrolase family protein [Bdellovibrionota bacterium]
MIIDAHVHVFPEIPAPAGLQEPLRDLRRKARGLLGPLAQGFHAVQPMVRHLPGPLRQGLEEIGGLASVPMLALEANAKDLIEAMDAEGVQRAWVIAHPPASSNEMVLDLASGNDRFIPVVNIPAGTDKPGGKLKEYARKGAKVLKIHAAADGDPVSSPRYRSLLTAASELGLPVVIHTGCIHLSLLYKDPEQGRAERFVPWFENHPELRFILAHMNFNEPVQAMNLCEDFANVWVDTSWQPAEVVAEAVRRIGASRILFGSDWPLGGKNIHAGVERIRECVANGAITPEDSEKIFHSNAEGLIHAT